MGFFSNSNSNRGSSCCRGWSSINMVHREVGGSNSESKGITQVVDSLDNAIGINITVASSCDSISSLQLLLGGMTIAVSIVELTIVILGMELVVGSIHCSSHHRHSSRGSSLNWGSSLSNWGSSNNWGSSLDNWGSIRVAASIRVVGLHNLRRGNLSNRGSSSNWCHSRGSSNSNWCSSWGINLMHREVGGSNSESKTISNVVHSLDNSIRIHIAVSSSDDTISSLHFLLDRVSIRISKGVLSKVILSMVLRWLRCSNCNRDNWGSSLDHWGSSLDNRGSSLNHWSSSLDNWCSSSIVFIVLSIGEVSILHRWGHHFFLSHRSVGIHNSRGFFSNNHWGSSCFRGRSSINMVHREVS